MSVRAGEIDRRLDIAALEQPVAADIGEQQAATPASSKRRAMSIDSTRPRHRPSPRSRPCRRARRPRRRCRPASRAPLSLTNSGSLSAAVPMTTRATPRSNQRSIASRLRMPPPSWTWPGKASTIASTASRLTALAGEGAVEIDDVEMLRARLGEQQRLRGGIVAIDRGARPYRPRRGARPGRP